MDLHSASSSPAAAWRASLAEPWRCLFANDFGRMKAATYEAKWGLGDIKHQDVAALTLSDLPLHAVDLGWASFPCQDLPLAGSVDLVGSAIRS